MVTEAITGATLAFQLVCTPITAGSQVKVIQPSLTQRPQVEHCDLDCKRDAAEGLAKLVTLSNSTTGSGWTDLGMVVPLAATAVGGHSVLTGALSIR